MGQAKPQELEQQNPIPTVTHLGHGTCRNGNCCVHKHHFEEEEGVNSGVICTAGLKEKSLIPHDMSVLKQAQEIARGILNEDYELESDDHRGLRAEVKQLFDGMESS